MPNVERRRQRAPARRKPVARLHGGHSSLRDARAQTPNPVQSGWHEYARRKQQWQLHNPGASPDEYERFERALLEALNL